MEPVDPRHPPTTFPRQCRWLSLLALYELIPRYSAASFLVNMTPPTTCDKTHDNLWTYYYIRISEAQLWNQIPPRHRVISEKIPTSIPRRKAKKARPAHRSPSKSPPGVKADDRSLSWRSVGSLRLLAGKPQNLYLSRVLALVSYLSNLLKDT